MPEVPQRYNPEEAQKEAAKLQERVKELDP